MTRLSIEFIRIQNTECFITVSKSSESFRDVKYKIFFLLSIISISNSNIRKEYCEQIGSAFPVPCLLHFSGQTANFFEN